MTSPTTLWKGSVPSGAERGEVVISDFRPSGVSTVSWRLAPPQSCQGILLRLEQAGYIGTVA